MMPSSSLFNFLESFVQENFIHANFLRNKSIDSCTCAISDFKISPDNLYFAFLLYSKKILEKYILIFLLNIKFKSKGFRFYN